MATILQPQQPDLRAFVVYDRLPAGCTAYPVTDNRNAPHLRVGDIAVIDPSDRDPAAGELFVIDRGEDSSGIVETWRMSLRASSGPGGSIIDTTGWMVAPTNRARSHAEREDRMKRGVHVGWVDGPYATEGVNAGYLKQRLRGRVVGILEPAFAEPLRLSSTEGR